LWRAELAMRVQICAIANIEDETPARTWRLGRTRKTQRSGGRFDGGSDPDWDRDDAKLLSMMRRFGVKIEILPHQIVGTVHRLPRLLSHVMHIPRKVEQYMNLRIKEA